MAKTSIQNIIVLPRLLSADAYASSERLFDSLYRRNELHVHEILVSHIRVLQFQRQFFALEQHCLIAIAAAHWPKRDVNLIVVAKVATKSELLRLLVNAVSVQALSQHSVNQLVSWHHDASSEFAIEPLFSRQDWSGILNKHRSSMYRRKSKKTEGPTTKVVDLESALSAIPSPRQGDGS